MSWNRFANTANYQIGVQKFFAEKKAAKKKRLERLQKKRAAFAKTKQGEFLRKKRVRDYFKNRKLKQNPSAPQVPIEKKEPTCSTK